MGVAAQDLPKGQDFTSCRKPGIYSQSIRANAVTWVLVHVLIKILTILQSTSSTVMMSCSPDLASLQGSALHIKAFASGLPHLIDGSSGISTANDNHSASFKLAPQGHKSKLSSIRFSQISFDLYQSI